MRLLPVVVLLASLLVLGACSGDEPAPPSGEPGIIAAQTAAGPAAPEAVAAAAGGTGTYAGDNMGPPPPTHAESALSDATDVPAGAHASAASADSAVASSGAASEHDASIGSIGASGGAASNGDSNNAGIAAITVTGTPIMRVPANETLVPLGTPTPTRTPTRTPTATPTRIPTSVPGSAPVIGGCQILPSNNPWNTNISQYPVHANSANYINAINQGGRTKLHPDWGGAGEYGIPYIVVPANQPLVSITWTAYGDESDPGPYPIPLNAPIEGGPSSDGDRHVLAIRQGECVLYELGRAFPGTNSWAADVGAKWPLNSNALRPMYWTSADAAGLPILPGLARYDEAAAGQINHALRFTSWRTQRAFILPATHYASPHTDPNLPPMGLRFRLKASFDISGYTGQSRAVLQALKTYGMILADNGSSWMITGAADPRWDDTNLQQIKQVPSNAFEVVDTGPLVY